MTETSTAESTPQKSDAPAAPARKKGGALGGKVLAELKEIAAELGIDGASAMRKGQLIDAIKEARGEAPRTAPQSSEPVAADTSNAPEATESGQKGRDRKGQDRGDGAKGGRDAQTEKDQGSKDQGSKDQAPKERGQKGQGAKEQDGQGQKGQDKKDQRGQGQKDQGGQKGQDQKGPGRGDQSKNDGSKNDQSKNDGRNRSDGGQDGRQRGGADPREDDDEFGGNGRRRNRRGRNRGGRGPDGEPTYTEEDVLVPAAGILDILDNYAFVRTTGYLPSENDVYLSLSMVRKLGLRKGDAVTGQVRQPREGERKEKFNPMVRIDTVNGATAEESRSRREFSSLTPVFPDERLRLETTPAVATTRVVDLVAPIGKGQRALLVAPPSSGRTTILQAVADAVTANNPECHLMVVLVDERPEEVTQMQRSVKGEVIASTFDRPASDHTTVAELAIERAKRLVELGHDVVVLLDSLTRLGRAYNQAASSGRIVDGGLDVSALHQPKRFFGAARNLENGGSLTILAVASSETGSRTDELILEELQGAATQELRLRRDLVDERLFPAVDIAASGTRRDDLLQDASERSKAEAVRQQAAGSTPAKALQALLERLG